MNTKLLTSILQCSNELITSKDFLAKHRLGNSFTRSGKLSFSNLIYFILQSSHKSISINYSQFLDSFSSGIPPFVSKQAVSKARQGISPKVFLELFRLSVRQFYSLSSDLHTWNNFHVYAVDGSTIQIPESKENYEVFGSNPNKTEKISPLASVSVLYDVMNDILVDVSLNSYRYNERESARAHMNFYLVFPTASYFLTGAIPLKICSVIQALKGSCFLCVYQRHSKRLYPNRKMLYLHIPLLVIRNFLP